MSLADRHIAALEADIMTARQHEAAIRADERERMGDWLIKQTSGDEYASWIMELVEGYKDTRKGED